MAAEGGEKKSSLGSSKGNAVREGGRKGRSRGGGRRRGEEQHGRDVMAVKGCQ